MFDGFLKPKFYSKCKTYIKLTKMKLDAIRKKKIVVVRYLKNDIAELIRNGHDYNAYGRVDGLLTEQSMLSCYDLINNFCDIVNENLPLMHKENECPKECRESVASLIYAAARFADLPELCHLRSLCTERYGNSLESFTNKEFKEKCRPKHHTKEMMLQLMEEIAKEGSIEWSSKVLAQNLQPSTPHKKPDPNNVRLETNNSQYQVKNDQNESNLVADSSSEDDSSTDRDVRRSVSEEVDNQTLFHRKFTPPPYLKQKTDVRKSTSDAPATLNIHGSDEQESCLNNTSEAVEKLTPRSMRTRRTNPPPPQRTQPRSDYDPIDEEERLMDGLLLHYSMKESGHGEDGIDESEAQRKKKPEGIGRAGRAASFPTEESRRSESMKKNIRTHSLLPGTHWHVHPKLPDCDELAARFAALKTRIKH